MKKIPSKQKELMRLTKETTEIRRQRLATGKSFRSAVFDDKRRRAESKALMQEMKDW